MAFYAYNSTIWQQGVSMGGGSPVRGKVEMRVVVDFLKELVKWYVEGVEVGSACMGKNLIGVRLVPYIQLNYPND